MDMAVPLQRQQWHRKKARADQFLPMHSNQANTGANKNVIG
jgi:hypothetical protein